jgi:hypothetical protein
MSHIVAILSRPIRPKHLTILQTQTGDLVIGVDAGEDASQDWAVWVYCILS